jgi:hypothetical protein
LGDSKSADCVSAEFRPVDTDISSTLSPSGPPTLRWTLINGPKDDGGCDGMMMTMRGMGYGMMSDGRMGGWDVGRDIMTQ